MSFHNSPRSLSIEAKATPWSIEKTRAPGGGLADQEIAGVRVAVLDQVRQHVELADVPRIDRVGCEAVGVKDVGDDQDVAEPVLHDAEDLVGGRERPCHVWLVLREVR